MSETGGSGLRALTLRGIRWKLAAQVGVQILRVATGFVIARLLTPEEYGLAAMVVSFSGIVLAFSDLSLGAVLVQRRKLRPADPSIVFWTSLAAGAVFTVAGVLLAPLIADLFGEPRVEPLFSVFSLTFVITAAGTTQRALLTRQMNFRSLEGRLLVATVAGTALAIAAAIAGAGAWAIVLQQLTAAIVSTVVLWLASDWRPRLIFSLDRLRGMLGFSGSVLGNRLLYYGNEAVIAVIIGRVLGAAALGIFVLAYSLVLVPFSRLAVPIGEVLFPAFSRLQDDPAKLGAAWVRGTRLLTAVCAPAILGLVAVAPEFVVVVLGPRWSEAVPIIRILAVVGLLQAIQSWSTSVLLARGRAGILFRYTILYFAANLVGVLAGTRWDLVGVAVGIAVASICTEVLLLVITAGAVGISPLAMPAALAGVLAAAVSMAAAVAGLEAGLAALGVGAPGRLAIGIGAGALLYVPLCVVFAPGVAQEARSLRRRSDPGGAVRSAQPSPNV